MSTLVLDAVKVKNYAMPSLVKSENSIQTAYRTSVSLKNSLPSSFNKKSVVNEIVNQIYNINKEINSIDKLVATKIESVKKIETKGESRLNNMTQRVSNIGSVVGAVSGAAIGAKTGGVVGAAVGAAVGVNVGKSIGEGIVATGAKIVDKVVSGVKKIGTSIVDGFKFIGAKVTNAYKSATKWITAKVNKVTDWVSEKFEVAKNWTSKAIKDTGAFISKTGTSIWSGLKTAWKWASDIENWKKVGASVVNSVVALVKGVVALVEAIGDLLLLVSAGIGTSKVILFDIAKGIVTGNWDFPFTNKIWGFTKSAVAYNWTNKAFDSLYTTKFGKTLDKYAYTPFKSSGTGCKIAEGVGYVAGVIALTICTFGAGGAVAAGGATVSTTTAMAMTATAAGIGKYTAEEWNKNSISVNYGGSDIDFAMDYEKYSEIEKLGKGQSTTLTQKINLEDGRVQELILNITSNGNGEYIITDKDGNVVTLNSMKESSTAKGLAMGTLKGAWEGAQWYVGGKIGAGQFTNITGKVANPVLKKVATSAIRVGLDVATGVAEVPFQSLVSMMSEGKTWDEAWKSQGGWDAVKMQAGIAGIASFGGEAFDLTNVLKNKSNIDLQLEKQGKLQEIKISEFKYKKTNPVTTAANYLESNINKYRYIDTNLIDGLNDNIRKNGLYHFTTSADAILESGYIKATSENLKGLSGYLGASYGNPKTFFFSGVPDAGAFATNLDNLPLKAQAIKIDPTDAMLDSSKLRVRSFDDGAISWDGRVDLEGINATKEYFVLTKEKDELVYKIVSEDVFKGYELTPEGRSLNDFLKKKKNINVIQQDYLSQLSMKRTNARSSKKIASLIDSNATKNIDLKNVEISKKIDFGRKSLSDYKFYTEQNYRELGGVFENFETFEAYNEFYFGKKTLPEFLIDDSIDSNIRNTLKNSIENTEAGKVISLLTQEEYLSCLEFSGEAYGTINKNLRFSTSLTDNSYLNKIVQDIDSSISKQPGLVEDTLLFRNVDSKIFLDLANGNIKSLEGKVFVDKGFMSTSFVKDFYGTGFDTCITIKAPKGTKALNMMAISMNNEAEMLLGRNTGLFIEEIQEKIVDGKVSYEIIASLTDSDITKNIDLKNVDLEEELVFFGGDGIFNRNKYSVKNKIDLNITGVQKQTIDQINGFIRNGQNCVVTYNSTSEISSLMLEQIDDLSKVEIKLLDGLGDSNGSLKSKYIGKPKYDARVTYTGYEMKSILERIENLQSKIDMNLPVDQRAKQIYEILATEVPVMKDFSKYEQGHHVAASLRGLIPENLVGKEGLVCAGYASVYKELCDRAGIRCDYVRGKASMDPLRNGAFGGHAWNVVYTDDGMIPVDVTWKACSGGSKEWFGGSDEFVATHIADADEISKNFDGMIPAIKFTNSSDKLNKVLSILDNKYGSRKESIKRLEGYLNEKNINIITRTDGARDIISTVDDDVIRNFIFEVDVNKKINDAIYTMDQKNGLGYGLRVLKEYLKTGNTNIITRTNGARDIISSLSVEDIQKYLKEFGG